uniref:Iron-binding zinc finger CDGSH type domain-containing protein n=1 Tax=Alexandrium catenella TaxID=2925 RepID=A0A7S1S5T6_ALECA
MAAASRTLLRCCCLGAALLLVAPGRDGAFAVAGGRTWMAGGRAQVGAGREPRTSSFAEDLPGVRCTAMLGLMALAAGAGRARSRSTAARRAGEDGKINKSIDLESPKVVTQDKLAAGAKKVYCRCWMSKTFPLCDGAHAKHNEETGDNVGPLIVAAEK